MVLQRGGARPCPFSRGVWAHGSTGVGATIRPAGGMLPSEGVALGPCAGRALCLSLQGLTAQGQQS